MSPLKNILIGIFGIAAVSAAPAIQTPQDTAQNSDKFTPYVVIEPTVQEILARVENPRIRSILTDLARCESTNDPGATNPKDLDGTPSHGLLQFKPSTLYAFNKEFSVLPDIEPDEIHNVLYDPQIQVAVAVKMIEKYGHQRSFWQQQWPACSKKYNYWQ